MPTTDPTSQTQTPIIDPAITASDTAQVVVDFDLGITQPEIKNPEPGLAPTCDPFQTAKKADENCNLFDDSTKIITPSEDNIPLDIATSDEIIEETPKDNYEVKIDPIIWQESTPELVSEFDLLPFIEHESEKTTNEDSKDEIIKAQEEINKPETPVAIDPFAISSTPINFTEANEETNSNTSPEIISNIKPEITSEITPEIASNTTPDTNSEISTEFIFGSTPSVSTETTTDTIPETTTNIPEYSPTTDAFNQTVNALSQTKTENTSFISSDDLSTTTQPDSQPTEQAKPLTLDEMLAKKTGENIESTIAITPEITIEPTAQVQETQQMTTTTETLPAATTTITPEGGEAEVKVEGDPFSPMKTALEEEEKAALIKKGVNTDSVQLVLDAPKTVVEAPKPAPIKQPETKEVIKYEEETGIGQGPIGSNEISFNNQDLIPEETVEYQIEGIAPVSASSVSLDDLVPETPTQNVVVKQVNMKKPKIKVISFDMKKIMEQMKKARIIAIILAFPLLGLVAYALFPSFFLQFFTPVQQTPVVNQETDTTTQTPTPPVVIGIPEDKPTIPEDNQASEFTDTDNTDNTNPIEGDDHTSSETPSDQTNYEDNFGTGDNEGENIDNSIPFTDDNTSATEDNVGGDIIITPEQMQATLKSNIELGETYLDIGMNQDDIFLIKRGSYVSYYANQLANMPELDSIWYLFIINRMQEILDTIQSYLNGTYQPEESQSSAQSADQASGDTNPEVESGSNQPQSEEDLYAELQKYVYGQNI